jgi:hypothetical protein
MDRISALRTIEEALADFEAGEEDLEGLEKRVRGTLRTYATAFEGELSAYRASGPPAADGVVVLASSERDARERVRELTDVGSDAALEVTRVE